MIIFLAICAAVLGLIGIGIWIYGDILSRAEELWALDSTGKRPKYEWHDTV